jgi:hypothetical protein
MLISTALLLDSNIRNSVCTPAKLPCRRVEVGYENLLKKINEMLFVLDQMKTSPQVLFQYLNVIKKLYVIKGKISTKTLVCIQKKLHTFL